MKKTSNTKTDTTKNTSESLGAVKLFSYPGKDYPTFRLTWQSNGITKRRDFRNEAAARQEAEKINAEIDPSQPYAKTNQQNEILEVGPVKIYIYQNGEYPLFRLRWKVGRRTFRRDFRNEERATNEANRIASSLAASDGAATKAHGEDIIYFLECQRRLGKIPLHEAVSFYMKYHEHISGGDAKTFDTVAQEMIDSAKLRKVGDLYVSQLEYAKKVWGGWHDGRAISQWSAEKITDWLRKGSYDPKTKKQIYSDRTQINLIRCLKSFLLFAKKKGYIPKGADLPTENVETPKVRDRTPEVFSPEELMRVLIAADKRALPYFAIMAFGAGRRAEVERLEARHIDLDEKLLIFSPEITKTNARRTVDVPDNLHAWLKEFAPKEGAVVPVKDTVNIPTDRRDAAGILWKQNALRHSFCSYHLSKHRNASLTSELAGNSVQMVRSVYKALVTRTATEEWFEITPAKVRAFAKEKGLDGLLNW
jgi:integrase